MKALLAGLVVTTVAANAVAQECPEGQVDSNGVCIVVPPPPPPPPPPSRSQIGESCQDNNDCASLACSAGVCINPGQPVSQYTPPPVYAAPTPRRYDVGPPAPDTTRNWHFQDLATYDFSMSGLGDVLSVDIPVTRLGNMNSSLSVGFGAGFIYSVSSNSDNFAIPFPVTVMWRYGLGTALELDLKAGGAVYYYSASSAKDLWSGKFVTGVALRIPFSDTGGGGLVVGVDLYINHLIATLPLIGFTI